MYEKPAFGWPLGLLFTKRPGQTSPFRVPYLTLNAGVQPPRYAPITPYIFQNEITSCSYYFLLKSTITCHVDVCTLSAEVNDQSFMHSIVRLFMYLSTVYVIRYLTIDWSC